MSTRTVSPRFVGRADELALLREAFARARAGESSVVLVGGEAGVGKTRLIRELAAREHDAQTAAGENGGGEDGGAAMVLAGGCLELGADGLPFAPFTAVLRTLVRELGRDGVAELVPGGTTRGLARLLPEFGEPADGGAEARARLFEQVLGLLERLAERRPVLLVIEDAHWADGSTRDLLSFLVRYRRPDARLLIVVTYRADEIHRRHPLRPLLAELGRIDRVRRLELRGLRRHEVVEQAAGILDREPSAAVVEEVYSRSEGNPLFVEALLGGDDDGSALPESLRDLLLASVERLPEQTREVLRVAAAGGARIEHRLLAAVAGIDEDTLARALRPAVEGNVLSVDGDGYAFRHALIHEAVHEDLLPGERTRLHTRFAEALRDDPGLLPAPRNAIELAYHWYAAHDTTWALVAAWHAAAAAGDSLAYDEQLRMLARVLELWDRVPGAAGRIGADHIEVLHQASVVAHRLAGEFERALGFATQAIAEIDAAADPARAAVLLRRRGLIRYDYGRPGALDDLRAAAALVPAEPPSALRARVLESLARMLHGPGQLAERLATAEEAMALAHEVGDLETEAHALTTLTWARWPSSRVEQQREAYARARELAARAGSFDALTRVAISESDALEGMGAHEEAAEVARRGFADAAEYGLARTQGAFLAMNLAEPLLSLGRWDEAQTVIDRALALTPPPNYRASLVEWAGDIALARGEPDRAEARYAESRRLLARGTYRAQTVLPNIRRTLELRLTRTRQGAPPEARERAYVRGARGWGRRAKRRRWRPCARRGTWRRRAKRGHRRPGWRRANRRPCTKRRTRRRRTKRGHRRPGWRRANRRPCTKRRTRRRRTKRGHRRPGWRRANQRPCTKRGRWRRGRSWSRIWPPSRAIPGRCWSRFWRWRGRWRGCRWTRS
ncbi:ATP-binding protein [Thermocatellispora tengchongensis]|uniref:ATP-binding protein n=1 Tax=Thermocatellispora tengchongensis TaxID=1073253 RepID=UPI00363BC0A8